MRFARVLPTTYYKLQTERRMSYELETVDSTRGSIKVPVPICAAQAYTVLQHRALALKAPRPVCTLASEVSCCASGEPHNALNSTHDLIHIAFVVITTKILHVS